MCVVIDTCSLSSVFEKRASDHNEFRPLLQWVVAGKGKIIYGGTKYINELKKAHKYIFILGQLQRAGKTINLPSKEVDVIEEEIEERTAGTSFNDQHLVAIVILSKCRIVCTKDKKSFPFLKNPHLYPGYSKKPRLYTAARNADLLSDNSIVDICRPSNKGSKDLKRYFDFL